MQADYPTHHAVDVAIVGGGVIGLSIGWKAAQAGLSVAVCDPDPAKGASWVAAGMLAPVAEAAAAEEPLARAGLASVGRWTDFAGDLVKETGIDVGFRREGTLQVAWDEDDRRATDELGAVHRLLGLDSEPLSGRQCRQMEPLLSPRVRGGLLVRGDWQVDSRALLAALASAVSRRCSLVREPVRRVLTNGSFVNGVELADGSHLAADSVVLASGVGLGHGRGGLGFLGGVAGDVLSHIRPVKGEILRLRDSAGLLSGVTVRARARGRSVYVVPRKGGEVVVGATVQEAGFDRSVRAGAVHDLLHAAIDVIPAVEEMALAESIAGLRPATPDNGPILGHTKTEGLLVAAGHYRNGVLLTPLTADVLVDALLGKPLPEVATPFSIERFGVQ